VAKQFATGGFKLAQTGSRMNRQVQVVLVKSLKPTHQLENVACKSTQTYKTYEANSIVKQKGGYSIILPKLEHLESNQQEHNDKDKRNRSSF
jgi:hypothetical protein